MAIDLNDPARVLTANAQVKITVEEIKYLQTFLKARDRGGCYYMALYQITGNEQCLGQAQGSYSKGATGSPISQNRVQNGLNEHPTFHA